MDPQNDPNAGAAGAGMPGSSEPGTPGTTPSNPGQPAGSFGTQPNAGNAEVDKYREENRRLNQALIEARRGGNGNPPQGGENPFGDVQGQYGAAIEIAEAKVRSGVEDRFSFYPEVPQEVFAQIRKNPWSFVSRDNFLTANFQGALDDIETYLLTMVNSTTPQSNGQKPNDNPANVNANPAPESTEPPSPGTLEDEDPWTMPLSKLEKLSKKEAAKLSSKT